MHYRRYFVYFSRKKAPNRQSLAKPSRTKAKFGLSKKKTAAAKAAAAAAAVSKCFLPQVFRLDCQNEGSRAS